MCSEWLHLRALVLSVLCCAVLLSWHGDIRNRDIIARLACVRAKRKAYRIPLHHQSINQSPTTLPPPPSSLHTLQLPFPSPISRTLISTPSYPLTPPSIHPTIPILHPSTHPANLNHHYHLQKVNAQAPLTKQEERQSCMQHNTPQHLMFVMRVYLLEDIGILEERRGICFHLLASGD